MYDEHDKLEQSLPREVAALEQQLASLAPAAPSIDRDRLMFAAGAASADARPRQPGYVLRPGRPGYIAEPSWLGLRFWQSVTALATAASIALATILVWDRAGRIPNPRPTVSSASIVRTSSSPLERQKWPDRIPSGYLGMRQVAIVRGVSELEPTTSPITEAEVIEARPPATSRQLLQELLHPQERSNS